MPSTKQGRVVAKITVPVGGWAFTMSVTGLVGTSVRTVSAGAYWPQELVDAFIAQLDAGEAALGGAGTYGTGSAYIETGTGMLRIARAPSGTNFAISAWGSTDLRDALGFAAALSGADNYTAPGVTAGTWLPHAIMAAPRNADNGHTELDRTARVSPRGHITALNYDSRRRLGRVTWSHVLARYAIESQEINDGESFERWWLDTHGGRVSYFGAAPVVRLYWDADLTDYVELRLVEPSATWNPERVVPEWIGIWPVTIDGYVVPS